MLIDRCRKLTDDVTRLAQLKVQAADIEKFQTRQVQLEEPVPTLREVVRTVALFRNHGLTVDYETDPVGVLLRHVGALRSAFVEDAASITRPTEEINIRFWKDIKTQGPKINARLLKTWSNHVTFRTRTNSQLLGVLERIPTFRPHVQAIRRLQIESDTLGRTLPGSDETFLRLEALVEQLRHAWAALPIGDMEDAALVEFLKAAGTPAGASLGALSPGILDWIRGHGLTDAFRIVIGN